MGMKRRDDFRLTAKHLSLALLALFLMTLFWDMDRNPFISTQISPQHDQSMEPAEMKANEQNSQSMMKEENTQVADHNVDNSETLSPPENDYMNGTTSVETKVCNYAKGRWVADGRPPYYPVGCKYIPKDWACRLSNRTDFSYENYRWKSIDCKLPEFDPSDFLKRMPDKTIAFVGDSLSREQFLSIMCMLTGGKESTDVEDVAHKYGFLQISRNGGTHHHGWAYRFRSTNTTIIHWWSARLCDRTPINETDPNTLYAMHLDRQPSFIRQNIDQLNGVLVINTGHHWTKRKVNLDTIYVNGTLVGHDSNLRNIENARIFKVNNIVKWLDSKMASNPNLQVFFRTTSPTHFFKGEWDTGGTCDNTIPMTRGSEVLEEESSDKIIAVAVKGSRVKILDITALSDLRDEAHISHYGMRANDCLHWCLPGVPDTWNELLSQQV